MRVLAPVVDQVAMLLAEHAASEDGLTITAQLGHANPGITFSTSAHLLADDSDTADAALSAARSESEVSLRSVGGQ